MVGGALIFLADLLAGAVAYPDLWINRWLIPAWVAANQGAIREVAMLVLFVATAFMLIAEARAPRRSLPRVLYILGLAAMVAIALQPRSLFLFIAIWTAQHWILAMGLASQAPSGEPAPASGTVRRGFHALNVRPWAVLLVLGAASVLLLPLFEVEANLGLNRATFYGDRIFGAAAEGLRTSFWVPGLLAIAFASGFVHYLLDRNVFRMSDPQGACRGARPARPASHVMGDVRSIALEPHVRREPEGDCEPGGDPSRHSTNHEMKYPSHEPRVGVEYVARDREGERHRDENGDSP